MISSLVVPASLDYLAPFLAYLNELSKTAGFSAHESIALQLANEEVFVNIVKHGFPDVADASFAISTNLESTGLSIAFKVKGMPFDPTSLPEYDPKTLAHDGKLQGIGMFLAARSVDRITFHNNGRDGYSVELLKQPAHRHIANYAQEGGVSTAAPTINGALHEPALEEIEFRPLHPAEAIEIARCAYEAYGYSYEDYIYYPEKIVELNLSGCMHSLVAVSKQGKIMGHLALKKATPDAPIAEAGVLFVRPEFRQQKIARRLTEALIDHARALGLRALFTRTVVAHELSQRLVASLGFKDCGILLGTFPADVEFKAITGVIRQKQSALIQWLGLGTPRQRSVFISAPLRPRIEQLYRQLGLPVNFISETSSSAHQHSRFSIAQDTILDIAVIEVGIAGHNLCEELRLQLRLLCLKQIPVIYLYLNAEQASTLHLQTELGNIGFFFAGIVPDGIDGHDALILQYLNNLFVDADNIELHSDESREFLSYIMSLDPVRRDVLAQSALERP
jgi:anti-sigma regulatory factor (Ser/Thr protein kinase)/GNAT superfamily N-acetyltransferase